MKKKDCCNECKEKAILLSTSVVESDSIYYIQKAFSNVYSIMDNQGKRV